MKTNKLLVAAVLAIAIGVPIAGFIKEVSVAQPTTSTAMHHAAHENCFIANSIKTNVTVAER